MVAYSIQLNSVHVYEDYNVYEFYTLQNILGSTRNAVNKCSTVNVYLNSSQFIVSITLCRLFSEQLLFQDHLKAVGHIFKK